MKLLKAPKRITNIIQISDVHIRNGNEVLCRYNEYSHVFENLVESLKRFDFLSTSVIVITGDTFHHKSKVETPGIKLFNKLMNELSDLCFTYIILGNHDFKQEDVTSSIDFLDAFKSNFNERIEFLENTGLYKAANVCFGLFSVKDSLKIGAGSGAIERLPEFPKPVFNDPEIDIKIALFHGTIINSKITNTRLLEDGYPFEWLDVGYDFALLGDVHLRQQITKKSSNLLAAYSGSLIQQNFGEELLNHGYINWIIQEKRFEFHNVKNNHGFLKLEYKNGMFFLDDSNTSIEDSLNNEDFPSILKIRLNGKYDSNDIMNLKERFICREKVCYFDDIAIKNKESIETDVNSSELFNEYLKEHNIERLKILNSDDLKITTSCEDLKEIVEKKSGEIEKFYSEYTDTDNLKNIRTFYIKSLKFEGILCYKNESSIDFTKFDEKTNLISAKNGGGKSSLFEIICIAIFGKTDKSIVTNDLPNKSFTEIDVILNGISYKIQRNYDVKDSKPLKKNYGILKRVDCDYKTVALDNAKTNAWVKENIGDINGFLSKYMITQANDQSFLSMRNAEQKVFIDNAFGLTTIKTKIDYLEKSKKSLKSMLKAVEVSKKIHANSMQPLIDTQSMVVDIDRISKELEGIQTDVQFDSNVDDLKLSIEDIECNIEKFKCQDSNDKETIESRHKSLLEKIVERQEMEHSLIATENKIIGALNELRMKLHKIDTSKEVIEKTLKFIYKFGSRIDEFKGKMKEIEEYDDLKTELKEVSKRLVSFSNDLNVPFNPSCYACIKNPIRIQSEKLKECKGIIEEKLTQFKLVDDYKDKYIKMKRIIEEYERIICFRLEYESYEEQYKSNEETSRQIENHEIDLSRNRSELNVIRDKMFKIKTKTIQYEQMIKDFSVNKTELQMNYWKRVLIEKERYEIHKENRIRYNQLITQSQESKTQLAIVEMRNRENEAKNSKYKEVELLYDVLQGKMTDVEKRLIIFKNYSKYLYQDYILPKITEKANNLIRSVTESLEMNYTYDEGEFEFYGKTPKYSNISVKKLSGFEIFIASLSIRIAIIQLTSNEKIQFLIDEGFTACDLVNISKIPQFLNQLTNVFKSLVLVSHIDIIKDSVDSVYEIQNYKINV